MNEITFKSWWKTPSDVRISDVHVVQLVTPLSFRVTSQRLLDFLKRWLRKTRESE